MTDGSPKDPSQGGAAALAVSPAARELHRRALVWDAHMDSLHRALVDDLDLSRRSAANGDLDRWQEGGIDVQVLAVWVDTIYLPHHAMRRALHQVDLCHRLAEANPRRMALARSAADVRRITDGGRLAVLLALEGGAVFGDDLAQLRTLYRLGVRSVTLTHSASTTWADASTDAPRWRGLNDFGRDVIREMNRLGIVVDVTHVSDDTVLDVLEVSRAPIIASHSNARALCDHPRNLSDTLIRDIAATGGVIGVNFYPPFLDESARDAMTGGAGDLLRFLNEPVDVVPARLDEVAVQRSRAFQAVTDIPSVPLGRLLDHIDHIVAVAGVEHVGLGSDMDGINAFPQGLESAADFPRITEGLLRRGYTEDGILAILGGNFMRVLEQVQDSAVTAA
ncbi:MAG TPA: dipeptidase [Longimicrobiales bacterium]|nr:dipeptidase [Longimicrobiales bacterium]